MIDFDPRFEIMLGTKAAGGQAAKADPYEAAPAHRAVKVFHYHFSEDASAPDRVGC